MPGFTHLQNVSQFSTFIDQFDNFLFDCDGVIWHGDRLIPGVSEVLQYLRSKGKKLMFVTNNATKNRHNFKAKFDKMGIEAHVDEIFGSAYATAGYMKYNLKFPANKKVYIIGAEGIEQELASEGIQYCGGTDLADRVLLDFMDFSTIVSDPDVGAVVCGFDMHINYKKIAKAHKYLMEDPECLFILTNDDSTFPTEHTQFPGAGSISAPLRYALPNRKPIVVGKPNQPMLDCILEKHHLDRSKTCMIGDRLDTDIAFGVNGGLATLLVLTGVIKIKDVQADSNKVTPTYVIESLGDLKAAVA